MRKQTEKLNMMFALANLYLLADKRGLIAFSDSALVSGWAKDAVAWAVNSGIIGGYPNGTLATSGTASRAEAAAMLQRFVEVLLK